MLHLSLSPGKASKSMTSVQTSALKNASVLVSTRPVVEKPKSGGTLPVAPTSSARTTPSCSPQPTPEPQIVVQGVKRKRQASPPPQAKKQRATTRPSKRDRHDDVSTSRAPRSKRGTPVTSIGGAFGSLECTIPRPISIEEDGRVNAVSSEEVVLQVMNKYKAFFRNPDDAEDTSFQPHPSDYPRVQFNYPNTGATETFALLFPIDKDDYQPIRELMNTIQTIVQYYLTPEQQIPFGHSSILVPDDTPVRASHSPAPTSGVSTPVHTAATPPTNLLRTLTKAYNTRNGPLFIRTVNTISGLLEELRPAMHANLRNKDLWPGVPPKVWSTVVEECYHRSVGPRVEDLTKYVPFSDNVYGELNASFISDIVHRTGLAPGKNFVDLGCGVGNCLIQASLQSGCTSKGIELLAAPASLAHAQHTQFLARLCKWGLSSGEVIVHTGDFCEHPDVKNWMATADLVLVNNWAFSAQLNERLSLLFLDLPDHAKIISLKPFVPSDFKLNQRTIDSPLAILRVEEHSFRRGAVSWTGEGGVYYLHTIDRRRICEFLENSVAVSRPTRSRR